MMCQTSVCPALLSFFETAASTVYFGKLDGALSIQKYIY